MPLSHLAFIQCRMLNSIESVPGHFSFFYCLVEIRSLIAHFGKHCSADLAASDSNPAGCGHLFNYQQSSISHRLSLSPSHHSLPMTS